MLRIFGVGKSIKAEKKGFIISFKPIRVYHMHQHVLKNSKENSKASVWFIFVSFAPASTITIVILTSKQQQQTVKNTDFLLHTVTRITSTAVYCRAPIMADYVVDKNFPAESLVPKHETGVTQFLKKYPSYNGQGVTVAIFDSGVDPKACGLEVNANQKSQNS